MKYRFNHSFLSFLILMISFSSCSNDDDASTTTNDPDLIGSWELKEIRGGSDRIDEAPTDEDPIILSFLGEEFSGRTDVNTYSGVYAADGTTITLFSFETTEVNDSVWGTQYYFALSRGYNSTNNEYNYGYVATNETLLIEYATDTFLYFEKIN